MMNRPEFRPFPTDDEDEKIDRLAAEKGYPVLTHPAAPQRAEEVQDEINADNPVAATLATIVFDDEREAPKGKGKTIVSKPPAAKATPRSRMKQVTVEVPDYAWKELKMRAVNQGTTIKHVILKCLAANRITIHEADLIPDGRSLRGKRAIRDE